MVIIVEIANILQAQLCRVRMHIVRISNVITRELAKEMIKQDPSTPAIGVENDAALVIVGNGAFAVSGDGKVSHLDESICIGVSFFCIVADAELTISLSLLQ